MTTWFITGASRGLGLEIARHALERGDAVVATARDPQRVEAALGGGFERVLAVPLDVADEAAAEAAAAAAEERFGSIDVLVNNAGRGLLGAVEEVSDADARAVFDTNVFGLLSVTRAVLPGMRRRRAGRIINVSSVGGFSSDAGWGVYCATKFAVEGLSEAMGHELAPLGISVTIIEPGVLRTDFLDASSLHRVGREFEDYADTAGRTRTWSDETNHAQAGDPAKAATAILAAADSDQPPSRLQLGPDCVERVEQKLAHVARELDQWRALALSTDHEEAPTP
jgi:NAD(P)-dependent dehydrogenase (short-subunit alcohol dehydrogenase family)